MPPLAILSLILFTTLFHLAIDLFQNSKEISNTLSKKTDSTEIDNELLSVQRSEWLINFDRRLKFVRIITATAPLLGLLGTVAGMLKTFTALSLKSSSNTIDLIASGISEALITTETGLSIAILGLIVTWAIKGMRRRLVIRIQSQDTQKTLLQFESKEAC